MDKEEFKKHHRNVVQLNQEVYTEEEMKELVLKE